MVTSDANGHSEGPDDTGTLRGRGIMVSYRELVEIRAGMAEIKTMLMSTLALRGTVDDHGRRIEALEKIDAVKDAKSEAYRTILAYAAGLVTSAIGGGALMYLPNIMAFLSH